MGEKKIMMSGNTEKDWEGERKKCMMIRINAFETHHCWFNPASGKIIQVHKIVTSFIKIPNWGNYLGR